MKLVGALTSHHKRSYADKKGKGGYRRRTTVEERVIVEPVSSIRSLAQGTSLRKVKTDAQDAYRLGELFYKETLERHQPLGAETLNLRTLTRQHEAVTRVYVQTKLQFQTVLDQVFPAYRDVFGSLYSQVALKVLLDFPTADAVLAVPQGELAERIAAHCPSRSARWAAEKAHTLVEAASGIRFGRRGYRARISC